MTHEQHITQLGDAIGGLAARIDAATYELLVLVREFDACEGWNTGFQSCAHWLNWRTGMDIGAAREKVRVARALAALPVVSAAMQHGTLSYSKVRAITRIATPENEQVLVDSARSATAAHVERLVRAWRRVDRLEAACEAERQRQHRYLETWVDEDGMLVIRGRLTPEAGALVRRALEMAADELFRESPDVSRAEAPADEATTGQRRADALERIAESALAASLGGGPTGDRYQVVIHVEPDTLAAPSHSGQAALEEPEGQHISAETSRRLACDATTVIMRHAPDGSVLDVGRKTRTIPAAIRRALAARDRTCRFPGCTARWCDAHHVQHWADDGPTRLGNLLLLCRRHHRCVHEEGWRIELGGDGGATFVRPDGSCLGETPPAGAVGIQPLMCVDIDPGGTIPVWHGERIDVGWAVDVLRGDRAYRAAETVPPIGRSLALQRAQRIDPGDAASSQVRR